MAAIPAPAVCDNCGTVFRSDFAFSRGSRGMMIGNKSGPCPQCGGMGSVPDGLYEVMENTLNIVSTWSPERIEHVIEALEQARSAPDPVAAARAVLAEDRDLRQLLAFANRLLVPTDPGQFWAFIAALFAILLYLRS